MPLPKTQHAVFPITMPSTKKKVNFRRFLSREEKILLMAKQSDERADKLRAMYQVVNNCCMDDTDISAIPTFDFDYAFLKLRAESVDNIVEVRYTDDEDENEYPVSINLEKVNVVVPKEKLPSVEVEGTPIKIKLKYVTIGEMMAIVDELEDNLKAKQDDEEVKTIDLGDLLLEKCIAQVYDDETVYDEFTREELFEWLDELPTKTTEEIRQFLEGSPDLTYKTSYKRKDKSVREVELRGIDDFFTL